jgi:hypothetical protein
VAVPSSVPCIYAQIYHPLSIGQDAAYLAQTRIPQLLAKTIIPTTIETIFVLARANSRGILGNNWGHDDTLIIIAEVINLVLATLNGVGIKFGAGIHVQFMTLPNLVGALKIGFIARLLYQLCPCLTKLGICAFYLRVF